MRVVFQRDVSALPSRFLYIFCASCYASLFPFARLVGFPVDYRSFMPLEVLVASTMLVTATLGRRLGWTRMTAAVDCFCLSTLLSAPVLLSVYLAMWARLPLADDLLLQMDRMLGFEWQAYIRYLDSQPVLTRWLARAYMSFSPQLTLWPICLCILGLSKRACHMVLCFALITLASNAFSIWFPAFGIYSDPGFDISTLAHVNPHYGVSFHPQLLAVREDPHFVFSMLEVGGIISFPSIHAAMATLCAWSLWPSKVLRYPVLGWNGLMALSAISNGGHYLVDVCAGILLALACIRVTRPLFRRMDDPVTRNGFSPASPPEPSAPQVQWAR